MAASENAGFRTANFQKAFDSLHPMLVKACAPIARSFQDIKSQYGISVETAELEVSFVISASTGVMLAEAKQNSSMTIKLILKPDEIRDFETDGSMYIPSELQTTPSDD